MAKRKDLKENYTPNYFLAALGTGGLSVSFFMYLNFLIPHPNSEMIIADILFPMVTKADFISGLILIAFIGIIFFSYKYVDLLIWNIKECQKFKKLKLLKNLKTQMLKFL